MEAYDYKWFYKLHLTYDETKATQCTRNLTTFSTTQCTQRCRCWKSGGEHKTSSVTLTTSIFHALETLFPFQFLVSYIYAIDYLDSCFDHFITLFVIWIGWQWKPKLSLFKVYSVLFVTLLKCSPFQCVLTFLAEACEYCVHGWIAKVVCI